MIISELIKTLQYELDKSGDSKIVLSIVDGDGGDTRTSEEIYTMLEVLEKGKTTFHIQNYVS